MNFHANIGIYLFKVQPLTLFRDSVRTFWIGAVRTYNKTTVIVRLRRDRLGLQEATYSNFAEKDPRTGCVSFDRLFDAEGTEYYISMGSISSLFCYLNTMNQSVITP